jgi:hypothetical protein
MSERKRDADSGQFSEEYPSELFLQAIEKFGSAGTADIAGYVGCNQRTAYLRLQKLKEQKKISSQKIGNTLLWKL